MLAWLVKRGFGVAAREGEREEGAEVAMGAVDCVACCNSVVRMLARYYSFTSRRNWSAIGYCHML